MTTKTTATVTIQIPDGPLSIEAFYEAIDGRLQSARGEAVALADQIRSAERAADPSDPASAFTSVTPESYFVGRLAALVDRAEFIEATVLVLEAVLASGDVEVTR